MLHLLNYYALFELGDIVGCNTENSGTGTIDERYMPYQISLNNNELWLDYIEKKRSGKW